MLLGKTGGVRAVDKGRVLWKESAGGGNILESYWFLGSGDLKKGLGTEDVRDNTWGEGGAQCLARSLILTCCYPQQRPDCCVQAHDWGGEQDGA